DDLADALWEIDLKFRPGAVLILVAPDGLAIRAGDLSWREEARLSDRIDEPGLPTRPLEERLAAAIALISQIYDHRHAANLISFWALALGLVLVLALTLGTAR